ncbi:hypothetical protein BC835DRAFT_1413047 [Cytidiella melzeri]|nr:hypothetical protein BC835DRAFT_1413047 [Cytidiella melzeri]
MGRLDLTLVRNPHALAFLKAFSSAPLRGVAFDPLVWCAENGEVRAGELRCWNNWLLHHVPVAYVWRREYLHNKALQPFHPEHSQWRIFIENLTTLPKREFLAAESYYDTVAYHITKEQKRLFDLITFSEVYACPHEKEIPSYSYSPSDPYGDKDDLDNYADDPIDHEPPFLMSNSKVHIKGIHHLVREDAYVQDQMARAGLDKHFPLPELQLSDDETDPALHVPSTSSTGANTVPSPVEEEPLLDENNLAAIVQPLPATGGVQPPSSLHATVS